MQDFHHGIENEPIIPFHSVASSDAGNIPSDIAVAPDESAVAAGYEWMLPFLAENESNRTKGRGSMAQRIRIKPTDTVGLRLTAEERELLLATLIQLNNEIKDRLRQTPAGEQQVNLTLGELDQLAGFVAAGADRTRDGRLKKKLDRIHERITGLKGMFETS